MVPEQKLKTHDRSDRADTLELDRSRARRHSENGNVSRLQRRVLLIGTYFSGDSGMRNVCEELARRLEQRGWKVVTASDKLPRLARVTDMLATTWSKRTDYDVANVDVFSGPAFAWAEAVCWTLRRLNKPYVLTLRGGGLPGFANRWPRRVRTLLQSAFAVATPSRFLLERMAAHLSDLRLLPNPLNVDAYPFEQRVRPSPRLVWMRAFHSLYNPSLAPAVLASVRSEYPDARLTMIGPDKGDGSLSRVRQVAKECGVEDRMDLPGGVPHASVPDWLARGDIFLNTTHVDNTPISVLEAMACGLCVVSTDVGGISYMLEHEHDALLVPSDDVEAMADAVRRLLVEPDLAARLSRNARSKAEKLDWDVILPQWERLLEEASSA